MSGSTTTIAEVDIAAKVEHYIVFMSLSDIVHREAGGKRVKVMDFSGAEPMFDIGQDHERYGIFMDAKPSDLSGRLDVRSIGQGDPDDGDSEDVFVVHRLRTIDRKAARGQVRRVLPYMADWSILHIDPAHKATASRAIVGSVDGLSWEQLDGEYRNRPNNRETVTRVCGVQVGLAFTQEMFWDVRLGWVGHPMIRIPTDPTGAREVFRLRDIPEGRARRAALRNWVSEHWRQQRYDPAEEVKVREHLRGDLSFTWNGLICQITPSVDDRKREIKARLARVGQAIAGTDHRPRG